MKTFKLLLCLLAISAALPIAGCYTDTVDAVSVFDVGLPLNFEFTFRNRQTPDTTTDHVDLNDYAMYRDNREDIRRSTPYQIAFWIESLEGNPSLETAEFPSIEFFVIFDGDTEEIPLARFENVKASDYFRTPHILEIDDATGEVLATALKTNPSFRIVQRYSNPTSGTGFYSEIRTRVDVAVRLEVEL
jgi:hypothetical protein